MYKVCKACGKQCDLSVKKCPEFGGKLKEQFTEDDYISKPFDIDENIITRCKQ